MVSPLAAWTIPLVVFFLFMAASVSGLHSEISETSAPSASPNITTPVAASPGDLPHGRHPHLLSPVGLQRPDITSGVSGFYILLGVFCGVVVIVFMLYIALRRAAATPVITGPRDVELQEIVSSVDGEVVFVQQPGDPTPRPMWRVLQK